MRSPSPFWPLRDGLPSTFPSLRHDIDCDVAVIGGGLTGSMVAYHLAKANVNTVVLDKRDIGLGSTSSSTALAMYEPDINLVDLIKLRGEEYAVRSYRACFETVEKLDRLVSCLDGYVGFARKKSLYLAVNNLDADALREEYEARKSVGLNLDYLDREEIETHFSFSRPAGILSHEGAQVDPYLLTYRLLIDAGKIDLRVFDRTRIIRFKPLPSGVLLTVEGGAHVRARRVVFASGYETAEYLGKKKSIVHLKSTYAIVSEPLPKLTGWGLDQCMIWDSSRPYNYLRTTDDNRIMIGGQDEEFVNPARRDRLIPSKARKLLRTAQKMFPKLDIEIAYAWAGTFGETEDSLPYVGELSEFPNAYFALAYGANGTIFGLIAAEIIRDLCLGKSNWQAELFGFTRQALPYS